MNDIDKAEDLTGSEKILVIDDDKSQRFIVTRLLQGFGYTVISAESGRKGVECVRESPSDIVLIDMTLEVGFDGLDTLKAIRALYPNQKAIIVSGQHPSGRIQTARDLGAGWLAKPYDRDALAEVVRSELDK